MGSLREFLFERRALTTVEFVIVFPFLFFIVLYALQVGMALFWWQSVNASAQLGARLAVIWDTAVPSNPDCGSLAIGSQIPTTNCKTNAGIYGQPCPANCISYGTVYCDSGTSGSCDSTAFQLICDRMRYTFPAIPANCPGVRITYQDSGLGFAGGPVIPNVSVTISDVPFTGFNVPILPNIVNTVPPMTAMLTGEDLSKSGGS